MIPHWDDWNIFLISQLVCQSDVFLTLSGYFMQWDQLKNKLMHYVGLVQSSAVVILEQWSKNKVNKWLYGLNGKKMLPWYFLLVKQDKNIQKKEVIIKQI